MVIVDGDGMRPSGGATAKKFGFIIGVVFSLLSLHWFGDVHALDSHACSQLTTGLKKASYMSQFGIASILKAGFGERAPSFFVSHIALASSHASGASSSRGSSSKQHATSPGKADSNSPAGRSEAPKIPSSPSPILNSEHQSTQRSSFASSSTGNLHRSADTPPPTAKIGMTKPGSRKSTSSLFSTPPMDSLPTSWPPGSPMASSGNPNSQPTQSLDRNSGELAGLISHDQARWPLILFSHGLTGTPEIYTTYGEQLASLGFIVIAPAHTDGSCAETYVPHADDAWEERNMQVNERVADLRSILDTLQSLSHRLNFLPSESPRDPPSVNPSVPSSSFASRSSFSAYVQSPESSQPTDPETQQMMDSLRGLAERIDFTRVGVCGHSFGGATAVYTLQQDPRIAAGVSWDGWMYPLPSPTVPIHQSKPFLFINSDGFQWEENVSYMRQWSSHNSAGGHIVTMKHTSHHNFNDLPFYAHPFLTRWISNNSTGWFGRADPTQTTQLAVALAAAFSKRVFNRDDPATPSLLRNTIRDTVLAHTSKVLVDYIPGGIR